MLEFITQYEAGLRLGVFAGILGLMAGAEALFPRKARTQGRGHRWVSNLLLVIIDSVVVRIVFPIVAVGTAIYANTQGWGVLNLIDLPFWLEILIAVIVLDLLIYIQHVASHHIPVLWALHKVHHADRDIDVTTGARFHPVEIILSMAYKMLMVIILGAPALAVIIFEIVLNACAMFNHSNVRLPLGFDRQLRRFIVTPDMHRVHHSVIMRETNSNFGFSLSVWDRLFRTYIAQPEKGHEGMTIGLSEYQHQMPSEDLLIFDVREPSEFMVSHIEGARRVPPDMTPEAFMARYHADLSNKTVIFYCSVGHRSSVMAARTQAGIRKQGALGVYNLEAGIFGWHNENRNLVRAGKPTDYVHPYNKVWQRFLKRDSLVRYTPVP